MPARNPPTTEESELARVLAALNAGRSYAQPPLTGLLGPLDPIDELQRSLSQAPPPAREGAPPARPAEGELRPRQLPVPPPIPEPDTSIRTGASIRDRAAIRYAGSPEDRLATARGIWPDAELYGPDNVSFYDQASRRRILADPQGFDWGDVAARAPEVGRQLAGEAAGRAGAGLGALTGPYAPVAVPVFRGASAAMVQAAYDMLVRRLLGTVDERELRERLQDGALDAATGALGSPAPSRR